MRPETLELEGFTAFRERKCVEFGDAELFALTGPTGAGKSSLIDAMIFALYGSVPRLGVKAVEPVISKGRQEARVRLDFALGGKRYTAVRVVRRTKAGATTKEARLESGEEVLAANAGAMNEQVQALTGLDFEQFTTCVALPQGEFARFLQQRPAERQQLLSQLLGLGIYDGVRGMARDARVQAESQLDLVTKQLDVLADVNKAAVDKRKRRVAAIEKLQTAANERLPELDKLRSDLADAQTEHRTVAAQIHELAAIATPQAVKSLAKATAMAEERKDQAQQALKRAEQKVKKAKKQLDSLGDIVALKALQAKHQDRNQLGDAIEEAQQMAQEASKRATQRKAELQKAEEAARKARDALDETQRTHAAHAVREQLVVGKPCPVCEQTVDALPASDEQADLSALKDTLAGRQRHLEKAQRLHGEATNDQSAADALLQAKQEQKAELDAALGDQPALPEVEKRIAEVAVAVGTVETAECGLTEAKRVADGAATELTDAQASEASEWESYHRARDGLAALSPPMPGASLLASWTDLEAWAQDQGPEVQERGKALVKRTRDLERQSERLNQRLEKAFKQHDVLYDDDAKAHLAKAVWVAQGELDNTRKRLEEKRECKKRAKEVHDEAAVAGVLEKHLTARGFQRWMLLAAFDRLVAGASDTLRELSGSQYTFQRNDNLEFDVVDHGNAGETRSAKTLSGGETFLASLALALTLSDQVADLAAAGTARLESIFLDEGFGSLDGETLDVVATAIEELATKGRTVGIVTHVGELAERIPVRFKVTKTAATAQVERVAL